MDSVATRGALGGHFIEYLRWDSNSCYHKSVLGCHPHEVVDLLFLGLGTCCYAANYGNRWANFRPLSRLFCNTVSHANFSQARESSLYEVEVYHSTIVDIGQLTRS